MALLSGMCFAVPCPLRSLALVDVHRYGSGMADPTVRETLAMPKESVGCVLGVENRPHACPGGVSRSRWFYIPGEGMPSLADWGTPCGIGFVWEGIV